MRTALASSRPTLSACTSVAEYILTDEWLDRLKALAVPGAYYRKGAGWVLEDPTPRAAAVALKLFPRLINEAPELMVLRESLAQDVRPIDMATPYWESFTNKPYIAERVN